MKLYATVRSQKTSKGIGDNDIITIELSQGNSFIGIMQFTLKDNMTCLDIQVDRGGDWIEIPLIKKAKSK